MRYMGPMTSDTVTPAAWTERGTPAFRRASLALFLAGFSTFSLLYCVQPLLPLLAGRRRSTLLKEDLEAMGAAGSDDDVLPDSIMEASAVAGDPRSIFLGRMYVMEGSTLGGQYIARHVSETLGLADGEGNSYFRGYGEATGERWREFRAVLQALPESEAETIIASAGEMFSIFRESMQEPTSSIVDSVT